MRKIIGVVALVVAIFALAVPLGAQVSTTLPPVDSTSRPPENFTICHFTGLAGTERFVELNLPFLAIFGVAGHFFENGTPQAGHEEDIFGPCPTTTTTTTTSTTTTTTLATTTTEGPTTTGPTSTSTPPVVTPFCVDVNTAAQAELEQLGGINPVLALLILANRPYESVEDLADVLPPGVLALILEANAQTGAFVANSCLTPFGVTTTTLPATTTLPTTTTTPGTLTVPPEPPSTLTTGEVTAVCVSDIPFLSYQVDDFPGATVINEIRFHNPTGGPDVVYVDQPLSGQVLWPGASDIPPFDWPGWKLVNGVWVEADDGFLWARETIEVTFTINPSATITVSYPPASAICANPENLNPNLPPAPRTPSPEDSLPFTGFDPDLWWIGLILAALGGLFLLSARGGDEDDARAASSP